MCQELRERFFDLVVWFNTMRKMLTGEGGRHRRTLRGRREDGYSHGTSVGIIHVVYESRRLACLNLGGELYVLDVFGQDKDITYP